MAITTSRIENIKISKVIHCSANMDFVYGAILCSITVLFEHVTIFEI